MFSRTAWTEPSPMPWITTVGCAELGPYWTRVLTVRAPCRPRQSETSPVRPNARREVERKERAKWGASLCVPRVVHRARVAGRRVIAFVSDETGDLAGAAIGALGGAVAASARRRQAVEGRLLSAHPTAGVGVMVSATRIVWDVPSKMSLSRRPSPDRGRKHDAVRMDGFQVLARWRGIRIKGRRAPNADLQALVMRRAHRLVIGHGAAQGAAARRHSIRLRPAVARANERGDQHGGGDIGGEGPARA